MKSDWIKIKEAKPDYNVPVLVVFGKEIWNTAIAKLYMTDTSGDHYKFIETRDEIMFPITHWMPLPKLPRTRKTKKEERGSNENNAG